MLLRQLTIIIATLGLGACSSSKAPSELVEIQSSKSGTYYIANQLLPNSLEQTRSKFLADNDEDAMRIAEATVDSIGGSVTSGQFASPQAWETREAMIAALQRFVLKNCSYFSFREDECSNMKVESESATSDKVSLIATSIRQPVHLQQVAQSSLRARTDFAVKDNRVRSFVIPSRLSSLNLDYLHTDQIIPSDLADIRHTLSRIELSYTNFGGQTISVGPILPIMVKSSQLSLHTRRINLDQFWIGIVYEADISHDGLNWKAFISAETRDPLWIDQQFY
jgi:hypothetical protein